MQQQSNQPNSPQSLAQNAQFNLQHSNLSGQALQNGGQVQQQKQQAIPTTRTQLPQNPQFSQATQATGAASSQQGLQSGLSAVNSTLVQTGQGMHSGIPRSASNQRLAQLGGGGGAGVARPTMSSGYLQQVPSSLPGSSPGGGVVSSPGIQSGQQAQLLGLRGGQQQAIGTAQQRSSQAGLQPGQISQQNQMVQQATPPQSQSMAQQIPGAMLSSSSGMRPIYSQSQQPVYMQHHPGGVSPRTVGLPASGPGQSGGHPSLLSMQSAQHQMSGLQSQLTPSQQAGIQSVLQARLGKNAQGVPAQLPSGASTYQGMQSIGGMVSGSMQASRPAVNAAQQSQQIPQSSSKFQQQPTVSPSSIQRYGNPSNLSQQSLQQQQQQQQQWGSSQLKPPSQQSVSSPSFGQQFVQRQQHGQAGQAPHTLQQQYYSQNHGQPMLGPTSQPQGHSQGQAQPSAVPQSDSQVQSQPLHSLSQHSQLSDSQQSLSQPQAPSSQPQSMSQQGYSQYQTSAQQQPSRLQLTASAKPLTSLGSQPINLPVGQAPAPERNILGKRSIHELMTHIDPQERLDPEVEDIMLELADHFIEAVTGFACEIAKHRKSDTLEAKDVLLNLERNWNITIPGFGGDEYRAYRRPIVVHDGHKQQGHNGQGARHNSAK